MKRQPYTKEELNTLTAKMEARLGAEYFYNPVVKVIDPVVAVSHSEKCRCEICVHIYLEAMEKRLAQLEEQPVSIDQMIEVTEITPKIEIVTTAQWIEEEYNQYTEPFSKAVTYARTIGKYSGSR